MMRDGGRFGLGAALLSAALCAGCGESSGGGAEPDGEAARCSGAALAPEALGVKRPIPDDPDAAPDTYFEDTLLDSSGNLALWIPPGVPELRGIFYVHGSSNRPSAQNIAEGKKWREEVAQDRQLAQRQLASLWGFALLTGATWLEEAHGYDDQLALLDAALADFAASTGRAEIPSLAIVTEGGSRFSGFGPDLAKNQPERMIAFVSVVGGISANEASRAVPGMQMVGEDDGGQSRPTCGAASRSASRSPR